MKSSRIKWFVVLIACILAGLVLLNPSLNSVQISGIDNYQPTDSNFSLSFHLFPGGNFIDRFEYLEGDYHYFYDGDIIWGYAKAFSILKYAPEEYQLAKEYCLQNFTLTDEHKYQIGSYHFVEHLCYDQQNAEGVFVVECQYPRIFNMFAYNDASCTLLFLGYYNGDPNDSTKDLALTDFSMFYEENYAQYYSLGE